MEPDAHLEMQYEDRYVPTDSERDMDWAETWESQERELADDDPDGEPFGWDSEEEPDAWETDHPEFPAGTTVKAQGWGGVAFTVREVQGDWARIIMVGDDAVHLAELDKLTKIEREEFCGECGQIGCWHDGLDRG